MTRKRKIFLRIAGLVTSMIVMVTWLTSSFAARHFRESTIDQFRQQLVVLSSRANELASWDDRLAIKVLLRGIVDDHAVMEYAFLERFGKPYVYTFENSVPRGLLALSRGANPTTAVFEINALHGERFVHLVRRVGDEPATLHAGLSARKIAAQVRPQILSIVALGVCAATLGILFAAAAAGLITREIDETTEVLHKEISEHKQTQRELARHRDQLEELVKDRTRALERVTDDLRLEHETAVFEQRRFMVMVDSLHAGIVFLGAAGSVEYVNTVATHILGLEGRQLSECSVSPQLLTVERAAAEAILEQLVGEEGWQAVRTHHELDLTVVEVHHDDRSSAGSMIILRDKTAERRMQRQMAEQEKIASIGMLAAGIAHEINNPLDGLQNCLRRIIKDPTNTGQIERYSGLMTASLHHIETVVRQLLDLSHKRDRAVRKVDVNDSIRSAVQLARTGQRWNAINVEWMLDHALPPVLADPQNLAQVFLNLVLNAVDAMTDGGTLTVMTRTEVGGSVGMDDDNVLVEIHDTGCGITPEDQRRIFEPFFTTKGQEKGTGLGLSVSRNLVVEHGGEIEVSSEPGAGTTFCVRLPRFFPAQSASAVGTETPS